MFYDTWLVPAKKKKEKERKEKENRREILRGLI